MVREWELIDWLTRAQQGEAGKGQANRDTASSARPSSSPSSSGTPPLSSLSARSSSSSVASLLTGIGDDTAVLRFLDDQLLITTDMLLDGVHFDMAGQGLEAIGRKAMGCSLSDCAAMAARPVAAVVAVALPEAMTDQQAHELYRGMQGMADRFECPIVGGDTTSWGHPLAVNVTLFAAADGVAPVLRSGACPGDIILVTGSLGGSRSGRHLSFMPRVLEARELARLTQLHAMIDLSDGLATDLGHITRQSHTRAILNTAELPISSEASNAPDPLKAALADGEDFELLFCVPPECLASLLEQWPEHSRTPVTAIGRMIAATDADESPNTSQDAAILLQYPDGTTVPCPYRGWEHGIDA